MKYRNPLLMERAVRSEESRIIKSGENWMHLGGLMPRCCKAAYFISAVYLVMVNLAYLLSVYFSAQDAKVYPENYNMTAIRSAMLVTAAGAAAMLIAFVLMIMKKYFAAALFSLPAAAAVTVFFFGENYKVRLESGSGGFVLKHLIPAVIYVLAVLIILAISAKDKRRVYSIYDREESALYNKYRSEHPYVSSDEWRDYLHSYGTAEADNPKSGKNGA